MNSPSINEQPRPVKIVRHSAEEGSLRGNGLEIEWSDGARTFIPAKTLRTACPCATCQEERGKSSHEKPLGGRKMLLQVVKADVEESLRLAQIWSIGKYALGVRWGDGHDSGIYPFVLLRQLSAIAPSEHTATER